MQHVYVIKLSNLLSLIHALTYNSLTQNKTHFSSYLLANKRLMLICENLLEGSRATFLSAGNFPTLFFSNSSPR